MKKYQRKNPGIFLFDSAKESKNQFDIERKLKIEKNLVSAWAAVREKN